MRQQQVTLLTHFSKLKNHKNQVLFQLFLSTQTNGKVKKNRQIESHYLPSTLRPKMKALTKSAAFCRLAMSRASLSILISTCLDFKLNLKRNSNWQAQAQPRSEDTPTCAISQQPVPTSFCLL